MGWNEWLMGTVTIAGSNVERAVADKEGKRRMEL